MTQSTNAMTDKGRKIQKRLDDVRLQLKHIKYHHSYKGNSLYEAIDALREVVQILIDDNPSCWEL